MLKNHSVATIAAPQFINIEPYNPLISQCEIKVLYVGENRNGSFITEEVANKMANSLPGTPIVAAYREEIDDFGDHGSVVTIEDGEVKFSCKTRPYGFVAPDAKVWFQEFIDTDEFNNEVYRKYLMTTGYLWTGQYPEAQKALDEGMPQSMELNEKSLEGHWAMNNESGIEFFIINDAIFSKLCILGSDVEPCFEGASVTEPQVSKHFSKDPEFMNTLFSMMNDLKNISKYKGGSVMLEEEKTAETEFVAAEDAASSIPGTVDEGEVITQFDEAGGDSAESGESAEGAAAAEGEESNSVDEGEEESEPAADAAGSEEESDPENIDETGTEEEVYEDMTSKGLDSFPSAQKEFAKTEDPAKEDNDAAEEAAEEEAGAEQVEEEEEKLAKAECGDKEKKYAAAVEELEKVKSEYAELSEKLAAADATIAALNEQISSLGEFKLNILNQQKDALIAKYHMLSDEDKADIVAHKDEYSLEEIDSKLALLYVKKNVDFSTVTGEVETDTIEAPEANPVTTFSLDSAVDMTGVPDIVKALRSAK